MNGSIKQILAPLSLIALFIQCKSDDLRSGIEDMVILPGQVNIKGDWIQVKTEFTNPDGETHENEYKVGHYWRMTQDSIFELVYPNYVCYTTGYYNAFEYGIRCSNPTYNKIQNACFRGDTLILGGTNEMNIEHEYFLVKSTFNKDSIDDLISKRINWPAYYGSWQFTRAFNEDGEIFEEQTNFDTPALLFINSNSVFSLDTLRYFDPSTEKLFSLLFTDPEKIHNTEMQLLFEYQSDKQSDQITLQYVQANSISTLSK